MMIVTEKKSIKLRLILTIKGRAILIRMMTQITGETLGTMTITKAVMTMTKTSIKNVIITSTTNMMIIATISLSRIGRRTTTSTTNMIMMMTATINPSLPIGRSSRLRKRNIGQIVGIFIEMMITKEIHISKNMIEAANHPEVERKTMSAEEIVKGSTRLGKTHRNQPMFQKRSHISNSTVKKKVKMRMKVPPTKSTMTSKMMTLSGMKTSSRRMNKTRLSPKISIMKPTAHTKPQTKSPEGTMLSAQ